MTTSTKAGPDCSTARFRAGSIFSACFTRLLEILSLWVMRVKYGHENVFHLWAFVDDQCLAFQELVQCAHKPRRMDRRFIPAVAYSLLQFGLGRFFGFLETFNPLHASAAVETV